METSDIDAQLARELLEQLALLGRGIHPDARNSMRGEMAVMRALNLADLANNPAPTPSQIAEQSHLSPARVANVLRALEDKGWIARTHDTQDRRRVAVVMTEQGKAERARRRAELDSKAVAFLRELGEQDAREALRILKRCNEILGSTEPETKGGDAR